MSKVTIEDIPLDFAPVPPEMLFYKDEDGKRLSSLDILTWCAIAMHRQIRTSKAFPSNARLADILDTDQRSIKRALARLITAGFLLREDQERDPKTGKYGLTIYTVAVEGKPVRIGLVKDESTVPETGWRNSPPDRETGWRNRPSPGGEIVHGKEESTKEDSPTGQADTCLEVKDVQKTMISDLYERLRDRGLLETRRLTKPYKDRLAGELREYLKVRSVGEVWLAFDRIIERWPVRALHLTDAFNDLDAKLSRRSQNGREPSYLSLPEL